MSCTLTPISLPADFLIDRWYNRLEGGVRGTQRKFWQRQLEIFDELVENVDETLFNLDDFEEHSPEVSEIV